MTKFGREIEAYFLAVGTIVGVGMFGIPFVFARAGFLTGVLDLCLLTIAVSLVHLAYADIVIESGTKHRLPGYVGMFLGTTARSLSLVSYLAGLSGALLAYLVLGGAFLGNLITAIFPSAPSLAGVFVFYILGIGIMLKGIRFEGIANGILTCTLIAAILCLGVFLLVRTDTSFLTVFNSYAFFTPYGILLFSLAGAAVIPDMSVMLGKENRGSLRKTVLLGTISAALLYLLFAIGVVGVTGSNTTPDAIHGIASVFGGGLLLVGSLIGFLAAITSFIPLGIVLKEVLHEDVGFRNHAAWFFTIGVPLLLFFLGFQDFITIISVIGALGIGIDSIFILAMHRWLPKTRVTAIPTALSIALALMFAVGIVVEVVHIL